MSNISTNVDVEKIISNCIIDITAVDESQVNLKANLSNDLGMDSLDIVEVVMEVEKRLKVSIPDEEANKIRTVKELIQAAKNNMS